MCVAAPGLVISINGNMAEVDFFGNRRQVNVSLVSAKPGDYVLVHAGCAIEIVKKDEGEELAGLLKEVGLL